MLKIISFIFAIFTLTSSLSSECYPRVSHKELGWSPVETSELPVPKLNFKNKIKLNKDLTATIPEIDHPTHNSFLCFPNSAQYKNSDWGHVVGMIRNVDIATAIEIANNNQEIDYFFYTKQPLTLETTEGNFYFFNQGDAVFFSGTPHWGDAPGQADGYMKTYE